MAVKEDILWADKTYTIREVATQEPLPIMVKVSEGIYSDCEAETFSQGDLLNINKVMTIPKVVACFTGRTGVREDEAGYIQNEQILIPLRYRGNLKVISPHTGKAGDISVKELCDNFPRFIKNLQMITDDNGNKVEPGEILELDRINPSKGLVLKSKGRYIILNERRREHFLYMPDETTYTLEDVVNRYPLPVNVKFIDNEFPQMITRDLQEALANVRSYEGDSLKLLNVVQHKVIVGHHKSAEMAIYDTRTTEGQSCQRTVVILPWDSVAATEIEVFIPRDADDSDYETITARNFSRHGLNESNIDGTLYLDMVKAPRVYVYEEFKGTKYKKPPPLPPSSEVPEVPPPVPKRVRTPSSKSFPGPPTMPKPSTKAAGRTTTNKHACPSPPSLPPRPSATVPESVYEVAPDLSISPSNREQNSPSSYMTDDDKENGFVTAPTKESVIAKVPEKVRKSIKRLQNDLLDFFTKKSTLKKQEILDLHEKARNEALITGSTDKLHSEPVESKKNSMKTAIRNSVPNQYISTPNNPVSLHDDEHDYDYPDISVLKKKTLERKKSPGNTRSDFQKHFESLNSYDLCMLLSKCHMESLARVCHEETLDGSFFINISDNELKDTFSFNNIQLKKFKKIRDEGWLPN